MKVRLGVVFVLGMLAACRHDGSVLDDDLGVLDDLGDLDAGHVITLPGGATAICYVTPCQGHLYACGDCVDNDGDGLVDSFDPECLGPCHNDEAGFYGNIPGQNNAPCKSDCYWDQDTGAGNDDCFWSHDCDPFEQGGASFAAETSPEIGCGYDPNTKIPGAKVPAGQKDCDYLDSNQSATCDSFCGPLTPNGCDCFGCCEDPNRPGNYVYAGSVDGNGAGTCAAAAGTLADPTQCKPCTPVQACLKSCGHCELCFGKQTLPADCYTSVFDMGSPDMGPPPQTCPTGAQPCGLPGEGSCGPGQYCITGCCAAIVL